MFGYKGSKVIINVVDCKLTTNLFLLLASVLLAKKICLNSQAMISQNSCLKFFLP